MKQMEFVGDGFDRPLNVIRRVTCWQTVGGPLCMEVSDELSTRRYWFRDANHCLDVAEKLRLVGNDALRLMEKK